MMQMDEGISKLHRVDAGWPRGRSAGVPGQYSYGGGIERVKSCEDCFQGAADEAAFVLRILLAD